MEYTAQRRLIIVSNRLPFQLVRRNKQLEMRQSDGGLVSALGSYFENRPDGAAFQSTIWIGASDFSEENWDEYLSRNKAQSMFVVDPIFLERKVYNKFYNGFCNATLWPLFHYFPSFVEFDNETFASYEEVNQRFADKIKSLIQPGDVVWIHDYQLMLLPDMIRKIFPETTIGFFLHIPFPSFEIFRLLHRPWKEKIIAGLLGADLIGFHTHEYVQHFLKTVQMIKGLDHRFRLILLPGRAVKAEMFPLGIDFEKFNSASALPEVQAEKRAIQANFQDKKIIFSADRLDYTKGVTHRLAGFERFLELNPEWREKVVFILVVVPSRQIVSRYNERKKLIEEEIGRINGKYSTIQWQPVIYRYSQLSFHELAAMYQMSDVGLITPLRDGMNLVAKEYVASRGDDGVLILSELAGAANELSEAVLVNPMDKDEVAAAVRLALLMPKEAQQGKIKLLQQRLKDYTVSDWMNDFLRQLEEVKNFQQVSCTKYLTKSSLDEIARKYRAASKRLLLLDYDGTLVPYSKHPSLAVPDAALMELLTMISADSATNVTIISGRDGDMLEHWFGHLPINLVAEHGARIRRKKGTWELKADLDQSWKQIFKPVLAIFSQRSPGAFVEEKNHTLVWHYRNVERELGFIRSRELLDNLLHMIRNSPLQIIDGNKVIEIRAAGVDKGVVAKSLSEEDAYDFIAALGDDKTDEDMFRVLGDKGYTIKIGPGHTVAQYHLSDQRQVLLLLQEFMNQKELITAVGPDSSFNL